MSRSEPWVGYHNNYRLYNLLCDTPGSNDLSYHLPNIHTIPITDPRDDDM